MKTFLLTLLLSAMGLAAQDRYVTITLPDELRTNTYYGTKYRLEVTNTFQIASGETAHLIAILKSESPVHAPRVYVQKNGVVAVGYPSRNSYEQPSIYAPADPLVVNGPAEFLIAGYGGGMATFKITPDQYPPDRTVVVPGGPGGATVTMECSTNLVHWTPAEGGTYTNLPGVKFFRIKLDRIQP